MVGLGSSSSERENELVIFEKDLFIIFLWSNKCEISGVIMVIGLMIIWINDSIYYVGFVIENCGCKY